MSKSTEPRMIEPIAGPYRGQRIMVESGMADQAIADGWAVDPFGPPPTDEELAKRADMSDEERIKINVAADKAARKLRGEEVDDERGRHKEADQHDRKGGPNDKTAAKK